MAKHSKLHPYLDWTKKRLDQMDSALVGLESNTKRLGSEFVTQSDRMIADLKRRRDRFAALAKQNSRADAIAWKRAKSRLESDWKHFDRNVKGYFHSVEKQFAPRQSAFQQIAAHAKVWRKAARALGHF